MHRRIHGIKRRYVGGLLHADRAPKIYSIYKDAVSSLSHPYVGGEVRHHHATTGHGDVMKQLENALSSWSTSGKGIHHHHKEHKHHHRHVRGGSIGVI